MSAFLLNSAAVALMGGGLYLLFEAGFVLPQTRPRTGGPDFLAWAVYAGGSFALGGALTIWGAA